MTNPLNTEETPDTDNDDEAEIPDVFNLRPLVTRQITLIIREIRPARFYYVPDEDDLDEQVEEDVKE